MEVPRSVMQDGFEVVREVHGDTTAFSTGMKSDSKSIPSSLKRATLLVKIMFFMVTGVLLVQISA